MDAVSHTQEMAELDLNDPLFRTDYFMVYGFKVLPCRRTRRHDWRECPFAHPGEVARRRDPRLYTYVGIICPDAKQNSPCPRGDACPYTHSLFEYWLHPTRYKTEFCSRGRQCTRPFCFFAHSETEVRPVDTDALLAVAMTPQIQAPYLLHQHHHQQATPISEEVAQTADLLQKTSLLQTPVKSFQQAYEVPLINGKIPYLQSRDPKMSCFTQDPIHLAEWGGMMNSQLPSSLSTHTPFNNQKLSPVASSLLEAKRRFSTSDYRIPPMSTTINPDATTTDEILSKLGLSYLQSAKRSYSHDVMEASVMDGDFRSPIISLSHSSPIFQNPGRSCKSFDSVILETKMNQNEVATPIEVLASRGRSLPATIQLTPKEHMLHK